MFLEGTCKGVIHHLNLLMNQSIRDRKDLKERRRKAAEPRELGQMHVTSGLRVSFSLWEVGRRNCFSR